MDLGEIRRRLIQVEQEQRNTRNEMHGADGLHSVSRRYHELEEAVKGIQNAINEFDSKIQILGQTSDKAKDNATNLVEAASQLKTQLRQNEKRLEEFVERIDNEIKVRFDQLEGGRLKQIESEINSIKSELENAVTVHQVSCQYRELDDAVKNLRTAITELDTKFKSFERTSNDANRLVEVASELKSYLLRNDEEFEDFTRRINQGLQAKLRELDDWKSSVESSLIPHRSPSTVNELFVDGPLTSAQHDDKRAS